VIFGEFEGSTIPHFTSLNSSSHLLVLALAATAVIAVVVLYFTTRCQRTALSPRSEKKLR
jgi:hypothetical protein